MESDESRIGANSSQTWSHITQEAVMTTKRLSTGGPTIARVYRATAVRNPACRMTPRRALDSPDDLARDNACLAICERRWIRAAMRGAADPL